MELNRFALHSSFKNDRSLSVITSVLPIIFFIAYLILPIQLYGSNVSCDPTANLAKQTNCGERSSSSVNSQSMDEVRTNDIQAPLILPDISPTREDLDNVERNDLTRPADPDDIEGNVETNSDDEEESELETSDDNSEENEKEDSGDTTSLIPFP
jgi:hypothetical protein